MEAFSVLMGTCQSLCRYVLFCPFHLDFLPFIWWKSFSLFAYISYQSPWFCLCFCFSSLSTFWGQGNGACYLVLYYGYHNTFQKSIHNKLLFQLNWILESSQISISEFSFWRRHSLLSHSTQLLIVILSCVCWEWQTDRDRCKGGWGRSSIKSRPTTWRGGRELGIEGFFLLEKELFFFSFWDNQEISLWERGNQNLATEMSPQTEVQQVLVED